MSKKIKAIKVDVPEKDRLINVEKALRDKKPGLLKWMPKFVLNYITRTVHEDELNSLFYRTRNDTQIGFLDIGLGEMGPIISHEGIENLPESGGVFITANHPLGGLDGTALLRICLDIRSDMKFFVNDLLMQVKPMDNVFIPVNKHGKNDKNYRDRFEEVYKSDGCLILFPAGMVSRRQEGKVIKDLQWKKSIIQKSQQYNKPIVPVHIAASNSNKFYNLAYWRKKFGIKANIEMFYLADEMYRQKGKRIHITFGKPIPANAFNDSKKPEQWVQELKDHVYNLENNADAEFG